MKTKLFAVALLAGGSLFAETHWSIGIGLGTPYYYDYAPPPPPAVVYTPPCPGPDYTWVSGYYYPARGGYAWHAGFWSRPPYAGAYWVSPRYYENRYYPGYWTAGNGTGTAMATNAGSTMTGGYTAGGTGATTINRPLPKRKEKMNSIQG